MLDPNKATLPGCKQTAIWVGFFGFFSQMKMKFFIFSIKKSPNFTALILRDQVFREPLVLRE